MDAGQSGPNKRVPLTTRRPVFRVSDGVPQGYWCTARRTVYRKATGAPHVRRWI